jgi:glycosyltransferase involved in cell wall biosynthesis
MLDLTIIILTYNSSQVIKQCLESFNTDNYQIFVIDNASSDDTISIVKKNFLSVKVIKNDQNIGFGRANNIVLRQVKTKYTLILNPDTIITDNTIINCLEVLSNNPEIALASPVIFNKQPENFINESIDKFSYTHFIVGGVLFMNMINLDKIGWQPCNPSIGGPAKSTLGHEVDALGGWMGKVTDRSYLHKRLFKWTIRYVQLIPSSNSFSRKWNNPK